MMGHRRFGALAALACASALVACGSDPQGAGDAGGSDATTPKKDAAADGSPFGDGGPSDAAAEADPVVLDAGGPFLCGSCVCDGVVDMCEMVSGGAQQMPIASDASFGDAGACDVDGGQSSCTAIPPACLPAPTCECVLANIGFGPVCDCALDPGGAGLVVHCNLP
jgi:hypothetical protein